MMTVDCRAGLALRVWIVGVFAGTYMYGPVDIWSTRKCSLDYALKVCDVRVSHPPDPS